MDLVLKDPADRQAVVGTMADRFREVAIGNIQKKKTGMEPGR